MATVLSCYQKQLDLLYRLHSGITLVRVHLGDESLSDTDFLWVAHKYRGRYQGLECFSRGEVNLALCLLAFIAAPRKKVALCF